jgi:DNA invertase Pin-like site-specific DNA recombinase
MAAALPQRAAKEMTMAASPAGPWTALPYNASLATLPPARSIVVVYKIDRLTRSLFDFAKIVEAFDAKGASFVSITQQFNTTTSMGRLTLNVLLSFAQFEREVAGERIRDKIAASKKKGMWMGGLPSFGYDVKNRKLVLNEEESRTVLLISNLNDQKLRNSRPGCRRTRQRDQSADGVRE